MRNSITIIVSIVACSFLMTLAILPNIIGDSGEGIEKESCLRVVNVDNDSFTEGYPCLQMPFLRYRWKKQRMVWKSPKGRFHYLMHSRKRRRKKGIMHIFMLTDVRQVRIHFLVHRGYFNEWKIGDW